VADIINHLSKIFTHTPRENLLNQPKILSKYLHDMNGLTSAQIDLLHRVNSALIQVPSPPPPLITIYWFRTSLFVDECSSRDSM
jgi:hypothetical protein